MTALAAVADLELDLDARELAAQAGHEVGREILARRDDAERDREGADDSVIRLGVCGICVPRGVVL